MTFDSPVLTRQECGVPDTIYTNFRIPSHTVEVIDALAERLQISRPAVIRRAIGVLQVFEHETRAGRYVGASDDREAFKTVFVAPV